MNCHFSQTLISAFIDRELDAEEKRELRRHLFSCTECNLEYEEFQKLKSCLENLTQEPFTFDLVDRFRSRLVTEERSVFSAASRLFWFSRLSIVGACLVIFFISTLMLFPVNQDSDISLARGPKAPPSVPGSLDQNFSLDQSVTVYQASFILP
jgi:hypothetical protein